MPVAVAIAVGGAFLGWVVWAGLGAAAPAAEGQVTGFQVRSAESLQVTLVISGKPGRVSCTLQAFDATHAVVGVTTAEVEVGADGTTRTSAVIRTRARAVTGVVERCDAAG